MNQQVFSNPGFAINTRINGIGRFMRKMVDGVVRFVKAAAATHELAYRVDSLAERYYAMNSSDLAQIGLTRDQIPAELRRKLCG